MEVAYSLMLVGLGLIMGIVICIALETFRESKNKE